LLFYFTFVAMLTGYIFALYGGRSLRSNGVLAEDCHNGNNNNNTSRASFPEGKPDSSRMTDVDVLWYINVFLLFILSFREALQFGVAPRRYFFSPENWLELTLIALTSVLLFHGGYGCHVSVKRHVAAIAIVLSWSEFITMIGRHPKLSTYNIYVTMFYKGKHAF
jgi:hypothetical protein